MDTTSSNPTAPSGRLDSWKEIAAYLKRDVRTVQRWEKDEGLPVHRLQHGKQGSVYAQATELDAWWESRRRDLEKPGESAVPGRRLLTVAALVVGGLVVAAATLWTVRFLSAKNRTASEASVYQFHVALDDNAGFGVAVSPDGRRIAFDTCCTNPRIWVHDLATATTTPVKNTEGGFFASWSPDGSQIVFNRAGALQTVDLGGGPPLTLCDRVFNGPVSWGPSGILASSGTRIARVMPAGGTVNEFALDDGAPALALREWPKWLADGRHFIYHVRGNGRAAEYLAEVGSPQTTRIVDSDYAAAFAPPSTLLFLRGTALMAQPFDLRSIRLTGTATVVASDVAPGSLDTFARFAVSDNGLLAFIGTRGGRAGRLTWFDRAGSETGRIAQPDGIDYLNPSISPDGRFVAVNRMDPQTANWDVWVIDLARGVPTRVTFDAAADSDPVWSPDGRQLAFVSTRGGRPAFYRTAIVQSQDSLIVSADASSVVPSDWTPDGRYIVYTRWPLNAFGTEIWRVPVDGGKPELLIPRGPAVYGGRVSPDGRWLAYSSLESGSSEIYVRPFGGPGPKRQISNGGGVHPRWTADGREIVYWTPPRGLAGASISLDGGTLTSGTPRTILQTPILTLIDARTHWDMTRDGTRLLARVASGTDPPSITVVVNWPERLKR
jgi:Tol biopolymer transport system component